MEKRERQSLWTLEINQNFDELAFCANGALTSHTPAHVFPAPIVRCDCLVAQWQSR